MTTEKWPRGRWLGLMLAVFIFQLALIFALSDRVPVRPRVSKHIPLVKLAGAGATEMLALTDPTLFALPHRLGFSGPAWLTPPKIPERSFSWKEEPRWLGLNAPELGSLFNRFAASNDLNAPRALALPEAGFVLPQVTPQAVFTQPSSLRIDGALAQRRLLTQIQLKSWAHTELLTNTVVQIIVDADGRPITGGTLLSSSGYPPADQFALDQARKARFEAVPESGAGVADRAGLTFGKLIFQWHTIPVARTNAAPSTGPAAP